MSYKVRTGRFEGPFDLLIYLIEQQRVSVYEISVSEITTQYLEYVSELKEIDPSLAEEFMVLAAELIEIKSRMLLPRPAVVPEGEEDPRAGLVRRILEYKQYKALAGILDVRFEQASHSRSKPAEDFSKWVEGEDELLTATTDQFVRAFENFLLRHSRLDEMKRTYEQQERSRVSLENRIEELVLCFKDRKELMFSEMIRKDPSAVNRVLTFVSILEMIKQGGFDAQQRIRCGDIRLVKKEVQEEALQ